jgi:hypothetical protein
MTSNEQLHACQRACAHTDPQALLEGRLLLLQLRVQLAHLPPVALLGGDCLRADEPHPMSASTLRNSDAGPVTQ